MCWWTCHYSLGQRGARGEVVNTTEHRAGRSAKNDVGIDPDAGGGAPNDSSRRDSVTDGTGGAANAGRIGGPDGRG